MDGYVLGMLLDGPKTFAQLVEECPKRPYNSTTADVMRPSVDRLKGMGVIVQDGDVWRYEPTQFALGLARYYLERYSTKQSKRKTLSTKELYICRPCNSVGETSTCDVCGGPRERCTSYELRRIWDPKARKIGLGLIAAVAKK